MKGERERDRNHDKVEEENERTQRQEEEVTVESYRLDNKVGTHTHTPCTLSECEHMNA